MKYICFFPIFLMIFSSIVATAHSKDKEEQLREFAGNGNLAEVKSLLAQGANVNAGDDKGRTALIEAADNYSPYFKKENFLVISYLIDEGANVNARDDEGQSVLLLALDTEQIRAAQKLISAGADLNVTNSYRESVASLVKELKEDYEHLSWQIHRDTKRMDLIEDDKVDFEVYIENIDSFDEDGTNKVIALGIAELNKEVQAYKETLEYRRSERAELKEALQILIFIESQIT